MTKPGLIELSVETSLRRVVDAQLVEEKSEIPIPIWAVTALAVHIRTIYSISRIG